MNREGAKIPPEPPDPIVTEVTPFDVFYPAKPDHQEYFRRNGNQPYCQIVINPKVAKLRQKFAHKLKKP